MYILQLGTSYCVLKSGEAAEDFPLSVPQS